MAEYIRVSDNAEMNKGLIIQAFCFALQEELHDYFRLLAVLEQEIARKTNELGFQLLIADTDTVGGEGGMSGGREAQPRGTSGLTLLRLRAWMQEPLERCTNFNC